AGAALLLDGGLAPIALDVHFGNGCMVDEPIDGGERHGLIWKHLAPFAEGLIGGKQQRPQFVAGADELEEDGGLGLVFGDVGEIVENEQRIFVELGDGGFEAELAAGGLQLLYEICGSGVENAGAVLDEREAESCREMRLSPAWRAEQD